MKIKNVVFILLFLLLNSCSSDNDETVPRSLDEFINTVSTSNVGGVIACAGNAEGREDLNYIFYYPEPGASDIRYYEAKDKTIDPLDFTQYKRQALATESVFGSKLRRFVRSNDETETWCLVTYFLDGVLQISNPILLKNITQPTVWENNLVVEYPTTLNPVFSWVDFNTANNDVYFQALVETKNDKFISGTYTEEKTFTYYNTDNVTLTINTEIPQELEVDTEYLLSIFGVSQKDNWVNLIIEKLIVPQNLEEYLAKNSVNNTQKITAFGVSKSNSLNDVFVYFHPIENARDFRYYETDSLNVDKIDFKNYRRKFLNTSTDFGAQLRRFSKENREEVWSIITYEVDGIIYTSAPIKIEVDNNTTQFQTEITTTQTQSLLPLFSWSSFNTLNEKYLTIISQNNNFISGFFVNKEMYQYKSDSGVIGTINSSTILPDLMLDATYNISVFGINDNNWSNLSITDSFEAK